MLLNQGVHIRIHVLCTMTVCSKFHGNPFKSCWDISRNTKDLMVGQQRSWKASRTNISRIYPLGTINVKISKQSIQHGGVYYMYVCQHHSCTNSDAFTDWCMCRSEFEHLAQETMWMIYIVNDYESLNWTWFMVSTSNPIIVKIFQSGSKTNDQPCHGYE